MRNQPIGSRPIRVPERKSLAEAIRLVAFVFLLALPFLVFVTLSVKQVAEEYRLSELVMKRQKLIREKERLILHREALLSPSHVDSVSSTALAMVPEEPQEPQLPEVSAVE